MSTFPRRQFTMMSITELHKLPAIEKLKIIEALWNDLANDESNIPQMSWHETELKKTEEKFLAGKLEILDWQQAKKELRSQFE
jgi:imidazoleglycerol phosphate synthase glutamine amidotransferase subunit HisH